MWVSLFNSLIIEFSHFPFIIGFKFHSIVFRKIFEITADFLNYKTCFMN